MLFLSRQFEWCGQIWPNTTAQCTFCTAQLTFCTVFQGKELIFDSAKCVPCSAKCALCSSVRADLTAPFKLPVQKKGLLKVSLKSVENWKNCRQISFIACLPVSPNFVRGYQKSWPWEKNRKNARTSNCPIFLQLFASDAIIEQLWYKCATLDFKNMTIPTRLSFKQ